MQLNYTSPLLNHAFLKSIWHYPQAFCAVLQVWGWMLDIMKDEGMPWEAHRAFDGYFSSETRAYIVAYRYYGQQNRSHLLWVYVTDEALIHQYLPVATLHLTCVREPSLTSHSPGVSKGA